MWRQEAPLKRQSLYTRLHGTSQETVIFKHFISYFPQWANRFVFVLISYEFQLDAKRHVTHLENERTAVKYTLSLSLVCGTVIDIGLFCRDVMGHVGSSPRDPRHCL